MGVIAQPPMGVAIETTRLCNLKCVMCPIHSPVDALAECPPFMNANRYSEMLLQLQEFANGTHVCPQFRGEPLLDDRIFDMIELARHLGFSVGFNTNGTLLNREVARKLVSLGVSDLAVSIDGATKETAEGIRVGSDFDEVVDNTERFLKMRSEEMYTVVNAVKQPANDHEIDQIVDMWVDKADRVTVSNMLWHEEQEWNFRVDRTPCQFLWIGMNILTNGDVMPCCAYLNPMVMGNAFTTPLAEIWNGEEYQRVRGLHLDHEWNKLPFCVSCDTWAKLYPEPEVVRRGNRIIQTYPLHVSFRIARRPSTWGIARNILRAGLMKAGVKR